MLRGISGCLLVTRMFNRVCSRRSFCRPPVLCSYALQNDYSTLGTEARENSSFVAGRVIDQGFTTAYIGPDGRKCQFAAVVVKEIRTETPPLRIWEEACALIGGNLATLAVAFISRPTESAMRTVKVFADQLSYGANSEGQVGRKEAVPCQFTTSSSYTEHSHNAGQMEQAPSSEGVLGPNQSPFLPLTSPSMPSQPKLCLGSVVAMESRNLEGSERNSFEREYIPLIGCIIEDLGDDFDCSDNGGFRATLENAVSSRPGNAISGLQTSEGLSAAVSVASGRRLVHYNELSQQDDGGEDGTFSDWETLFEEYGEEAMKALDLTAESDDDEEDTWCNVNDEKVSREELVNFLNTLVELKTPDVESAGHEYFWAGNRTEQISRLLNREISDMEGDREVTTRIMTGKRLLARLGRYVKASGLRLLQKSQADFGGILDSALFSDVESTVIVNEAGGTALSGSDFGKKNLACRLVLCVGHMPGAKAVSFHSSTTGLPRLPDLEKAVIENNPHCLLLGAPGFVFPDFIQRLASVFPASSRAGAFLAPLFTSKRNQWKRVAAENHPGPLICGSQLCTSGVVGLAVSSKEKGYGVPIGAFAEFARMTVGMPRIRGLTFLDDAVSKCLFLPQNCLSRDFLWSVKGVAAPTSVLSHLKLQLDNDNAGSLRTLNSALCGTVNTSKKSTSATTQLGSPSLDEETNTLEKLPLAVLDSVLFPGWSTPFYIYEPCYRLMVRQCLEQGKPFGLSSICNESWSADPVDSAEVIGTIVNVKVHAFERDCRSYIIAQGVSRFRVERGRIWAQPGSFGLTMGQVQVFDDSECETAVEKEELLELANRAVTLCCKIVSEAQSPRLVGFIGDPRLASFAVGHVLDVPMRVKRRWLKMTDTKTRLLEQITFLETKIPTIKLDSHPDIK